jgi:hypothetical protein
MLSNFTCQMLPSTFHMPTKHIWHSSPSSLLAMALPIMYRSYLHRPSQRLSKNRGLVFELDSTLFAVRQRDAWPCREQLLMWRRLYLSPRRGEVESAGKSSSSLLGLRAVHRNVQLAGVVHATFDAWALDININAAPFVE